MIALANNSVVATSEVLPQSTADKTEALSTTAARTTHPILLLENGTFFLPVRDVVAEMRILLQRKVWCHKSAVGLLVGGSSLARVGSSKRRTCRPVLYGSRYAK